MKSRSDGFVMGWREMCGHALSCGQNRTENVVGNKKYERALGMQRSYFFLIFKIKALFGAGLCHFMFNRCEFAFTIGISYCYGRLLGLWMFFTRNLQF